MNLESQVCSLEHAKKLKELGFKQESLFYWRIGGAFKNPPTTVLVPESDRHVLRTADGAHNYISAYTVAELGEMFDDGDLFVKAYGEVFNFRGTARIGELGILNLMKNPDMSAKMLIWLVENKHLNPKEGE